MPKRYPPQVRETAVRPALEHPDEYGSAYAVAHAIGPRVDMHPEVLRVWIVAELMKAAAERTVGDIERAGVRFESPLGQRASPAFCQSYRCPAAGLTHSTHRIQGMVDA